MNEKFEEIKSKFDKYERSTTYNVSSGEIEWLIEQAEKLERIKGAFYNDNLNVTDYMRVALEVFEGENLTKRKGRQ